jgi:hypothetical protein
MARIMGVLLIVALASGCATRPGKMVGESPVTGPYVEPGLTDDMVLQSFRFQFLNGDHHLGQVRQFSQRSLEDGSVSVSALFADSNFDDPWSFTAEYVVVPGLPTLENNCVADHSGTCDIDLGEDVINGDHRFALVGFEIYRIGGGDHHVKSIGILPGIPSGNLLRATFQDDSPGDDQFHCRVQYKLIPFNRESDFPVRRFFSGGNLRRITESLGGEPDDRVLSGFQFNYRGNDAHVLELGANAKSGEINFRDNDLEELISWDVAWLQLEDWRE